MVNSSDLMQKAGVIYFEYLSINLHGVDPIGVVIHRQSEQGRIVFENPPLLLNEQYLRIEYLSAKKSGSRKINCRKRALQAES